MKKILVVAVILLTLLGIVYLKYNVTGPGDPRGNLYAGTAACMKCHSGISNSYLHTAHFIASSPASLKTIHGSFSTGLNTLNISDHEKIMMEKGSNGLYQTWYVNGKVKESRRFDIVLGGVKGESYLYWNDNGLNQLPVSYYSAQDKWLTSPRFDPRFVNFNRAITSRCFECHASYIGDEEGNGQKLNVAEQFDKKSLIYSVDCERCHGPGAQHVDFQTNNPGIKTAKYIASFSALPRARKMDACAVCHSGNKSQMLSSTFGFKPGDTLAKFKLPDFSAGPDTGHLDVHGNQVQLLQSSKCFLNSKMDCTTCHNPHQNQRGQTALFTQKCMACHSIINHNYCKMATPANAALIKSNCIQCHMPALLSNAIVTTNVNKALPADILVHTHRIAIYPQEVKKITAMFGK